MRRYPVLFALALAVPRVALAAEPSLDGDGPYPAETQFNVSLTLAGQTMKVDLFAPQGAPPAPLIVGAHGLQGTKEELTGWGTHFATHGFAVAIPQFIGTNDAAAPGNADFEIALLDWMQAQGTVAGSFLRGRVDGSHRAIFGHSMGGLVTHLAAAKSSSIQVALALDGVDVNSAAAQAVPRMHAFPVELRASIQSVCNAAAPNEIAVIAAFPGPYLVLTVANTLHCDPQDPETTACIGLCAALPADPWYALPNRDAIKVFRRYATAAMRYFLLCDAEARSNLDGAAQQADLGAGLITGFTAHNIPDLSGCERTMPDAGPSEMDAGIEEMDAGSPQDDEDAGAADAGVMEQDAGMADTDGGEFHPIDQVPDPDTTRTGGCECSGVGALGPLALLGLLTARRRRS